MKRILAFFLFFTALAGAQTPAIQINFGPWTDLNQTPQFDNRTIGAVYWVMTYQITGFSAISLEFDSATGAVSPGSFGLFSGAVTTGSNPSTSVACATVTNCTVVFTGAVGWEKVKFSSYTGLGTIQGVVKGYITGVPLGGNSPGGSGCPNPCPVVGTAAAGAVPSGSPVQIAGQDGTDIRTLKTDTTGQIAVQQATASSLNTTAAQPTAANLNATVLQAGDGTFSSGQQAVTGTAANLGTATSRAVCVVALLANTIPVYLGASGVTTSTGLQLNPGQGTCQPVNNTNLIYVIATTTGASVSWSLVN